ncbi:hypothetical protein ACFPRL_16020 [Pseudoclavibacter helvolus]
MDAGGNETPQLHASTWNARFTAWMAPITHSGRDKIGRLTRLELGEHCQGERSLLP